MCDFSNPKHLEFVISAEHRDVVMEDGESNSTQAVIKHCSIFIGEGKEGFLEYNINIRVYRLLYSKAISGVF